MPRSKGQKEKLLYLQKILLEKTDENNPMSISEIKSALASYGISSERKSLYDDLEALEHFGLDICRARISTVKYYVGDRTFQLAELKLLVDAIQSSRFITRKKTFELIDKLEGLVSENDGKQLQRQVYITNRVKTPNERIYYNVDKIHDAISKEKSIKFTYYRWEITPERKIVKIARKNGEPYIVSPWALCWDDENYYMIAYDSEAEMIKHYRVDKMDNIELTDLSRDGKDKFDKFDLAKYSKGVFSMFGGEETKVRLQVDNSLAGVIADRFGSDIFITKPNSQTFCVNVNVMLSPQFYAWLFGLGEGVKILSPQSAINEFKAKVAKITELYRE